jgi:hypothetical protein
MSVERHNAKAQSPALKQAVNAKYSRYGGRAVGPAGQLQRLVRALRCEWTWIGERLSNQCNRFQQ